MFTFGFEASFGGLLADLGVDGDVDSRGVVGGAEYFFGFEEDCLVLEELVLSLLEVFEIFKLIQKLI